MSYSGICESFLIFKNGKEAYDHLSIIIKENKSLPDIILLDINMPIMNGWQFLDEIIKINIPKELKIFIVSSSENPEDIEINAAVERQYLWNFCGAPWSSMETQ